MVSKGIWLWLVALTICVGLSSTACATATNDEVAAPTARVVSLDLSTTSLAILKGKSATLVATSTDASGKVEAHAPAVWESNDTDVATVDASGTVTAIRVGIATIRATLGGVTATARLYVKGQPFDLAIAPLSGHVEINRSHAFTAERTNDDGSTQDVSKLVTWTSTDLTVATIDATGIAHGVGVGTSTIVAVLGGVSARASLTVSAVQVVSIAITPKNPTVAVSEAVTFAVTATFSDGSTGDVTPKIAWMSGDEKIATVDVGGTAIGRGVGKAQIVANLGGITTVTELVVKPAALARIEVTPTKPTGTAGGGTLALKATAIYGDGRLEDVTTEATWRSSDTTVAGVDASGVVTPIATGVVEISANYKGLESRAVLTVN